MTEEQINALLFYGTTILFFLLISAFFSASETALTAVSRARIYQLVMDGNKAAKVVSRLRQNKESMIGTILLGNNAVNIAASTLATSLSLQLLGDDESGSALIIATIVMTLLVVIFCEVLPKTYAIQQAERVSLSFGGVLQVCVWVLYPFTRMIQYVIQLLYKIMGVDAAAASLISANDVIRGTIELHHKEGAMVKQTRDMLGSILDLNEVEVREVMLHRREVETLDIDVPVNLLIEQAVTTRHSRMPIWKNEPDNIIGLLHMKSLIHLLNQQRGSGKPVTSAQVLALCQKPWFIPETTSLRAQLLAFRNRRQHFACVVDEYGAWQGIVTLEDIIEEIVGNIEDEHDENHNDMQKLNDTTYIINGSEPIRDVNRQLDWGLPDDHAATIAGLLIHEVESIPPVGSQFELYGCRFTVVTKDATRITRLRVEKLAVLDDDAED